MAHTRQHKTSSVSTTNHAGNMREFHYRIEKSIEEIWGLLEMENVLDPLRYRLDAALHIITFHSDLPDGSLDIAYRIHLEQHDGHTILKVVQVNHLLEKNKFAWLQNDFWMKKLDAVPIPFELKNQIS